MENPAPTIPCADFHLSLLATLAYCVSAIGAQFFNHLGYCYYNKSGPLRGPIIRLNLHDSRK
jgi:hypothetical protein